MADPTTVKAGDHIAIDAHRGGERQHINYIVQPTCDEDVKGIWYCVTHGESLANNFQKDSHIDQGQHRLAWLCYKHGYEEP